MPRRRPSSLPRSLILAGAVALSALSGGLLSPPSVLAATVDLTQHNRRPPIGGLPDWSKVGYERGEKPLPDDSQVKTVVSPDVLASKYGVIPNDGQDDTSGLERAINDFSNTGRDGTFVVIQLPAGTLNLRYTIYLDANYLILRGAGNDPNNGGTVLEFRPDENTRYDVLEPKGDRWSEEGMYTAWAYDEPDGTLVGGIRHVTGNATSGWLWPGRSVFRVGSKRVANKFGVPRDLAPDNRKDIFFGTVNYHWRNDTKVKGFMADQTKDIAGFLGYDALITLPPLMTPRSTNKVYYDAVNGSYPWRAGVNVWIAVPARYYDYAGWNVQEKSYFRNEYMYQDWFIVESAGTDEEGSFLLLDHNLRFNVYSSSTSGGAPAMEDKAIPAKASVMPIEFPVTHVGIEDLYITQPMDGLTPADAEHNYGNMDPASAMHGIVLRYAQNCWIRNIRTFMTGSHPIATESAKWIQVQDNYFEGSWNKGAGGNGYVRGSRVWDSLYYNNTLRNLRHFTFQWCAMGNVAIMNNMTNDFNLHGGWEGFNLVELNIITVPYSHRPGSCRSNCGGEGGSSEDGTWAPIYWSTGNKASKWSGASGPQNVFYRNYMLKKFAPNTGQVDYLPYFDRGGSLSDTIWQFGWDRGSAKGSRYEHLSVDGSTPLPDWATHERDHFHEDPAVGVNGRSHDRYTSLFLGDLSNATGVPTFSSIAGYAYCRGKTPPKVVGAGSRECLPWSPSAIDVQKYTHIIYAYATLASDGTVSLTADQRSQMDDLIQQKLRNQHLKVYIAVGGWGLGMDASGLLAIATNNGARTKFGTTARSLVASLAADGIDLEWSPCAGSKCISATQFATIALALKAGLKDFDLSLSTPNDFWSLSGLNTVTTNLTAATEFISLITHQAPLTDNNPNSQVNILATLEKAQRAGMEPNHVLMGLPFYARSLDLKVPFCDDGICDTTGSTRTSSCVSKGSLGQGTFPYYAMGSILDGGEHFDTLDYQTISSDDDDTEYMQLVDGNIILTDTVWSVTKKSGTSQDFCMGGVSVFSIDQDDQITSLAGAIFAPGGLTLPPATDIVAGFHLQGLDSDGFLREESWSSFLGTVTSQYNDAGAVGIYQMLLFGALEIQTQIANRLRVFLTDTELQQDSFDLYKRWEAKATNYQIANVTGLASEDPDWSYCDTVTWTLKDHDAFKTFLNNSLGLDLDTLITGSFYVDRFTEDCVHSPPQPPHGPGDGRQSAPPPAKRAGIPGDPYDPPDNCRTLWDGIRVIDPDKYFASPKDIINNFVTASDIAVQAYTVSAQTYPSPFDLALMLQDVLTTISLGNQTVANILAYKDEVHKDQQLQEAFDQAHARESVARIIVDVLLAVLTFIPGVGEVADLAIGGLDAWSLFSKGLDVISLAGTLGRNGELANLARSGFATLEQLFVASRRVETVLTKETRATRGALGARVDGVTDHLLECSFGDIGELVLDGAGLAASLLPPGRKRELPGSSFIDTAAALSAPRLMKRMPPKAQKCMFLDKNAGNFKGTAYQTRCKTLNQDVTILELSDKRPTGKKTVKYSDCRALDGGDFGDDACTCDHLVEASEAVLWTGISDDKLQGLCDFFTANLPTARLDFAGILNGAFTEVVGTPPRTSVQNKDRPPERQNLKALLDGNYKLGTFKSKLIDSASIFQGLLFNIAP
ncbi:hypothetical protein AURDEDRAFT_173595 [Auricularia subglabra TFB-10046 SS5]|uniref:GH18 domain-containing protein n=1 Tax=Auricularia subglabra (strain TFB-10046 / SS5) TaxID=717982 RepID=J0LHB0_AURST|nr:hypothetical protein AURDEDRAFT_173595 [Auricularia subglabra TFB-10046 SS5]